MTTEYEFHPIASIFPILPTNEIAALAQDISEHGLRHKITLFEGKVLDGRNRYEACRKFGIKPEFTDWNGTFTEAIQLVWSENINRRHLDSGQRAIAWVKRSKMEAEFHTSVVVPIREEAKDKQRAHGGTAPGKKGTLRQSIAEVKPDDRKSDAAEAKLAGTNRTTLAQARIVEEKAPDKADEIMAGTKSITQAMREIKRQEVSKKVREFPSDKYRVLYADPPWQYSDTREGLRAHGYSGAQDHYPTLSVSELSALDISAISEPNSVLFCWATFPLLPDALEVVLAWGFAYKTAFVWDKQRGAFGHYHDASAELLIVAVRGSCTPDIDKKARQVHQISRGKHSEKPEAFRALIDEMYPYGKRIELFARQRAEGWDSYGNEV